MNTGERQQRPSIADSVALACRSQTDLLGRPLTDAEHGCIRAGFHAGLLYRVERDGGGMVDAATVFARLRSVPPRGLPHEIYVHVHHALRALQKAGQLEGATIEGMGVARERLGMALAGLRMWKNDAEAR